MVKNQIIEQLREAPRPRSELSYQGLFSSMSCVNRCMVRIIKVAGTRAHRHAIGAGTAVYYLEGDEDRAFGKFVKANNDVLEKLDFSANTVLDFGLPKNISQGIRAIL